MFSHGETRKTGGEELQHGEGWVVEDGKSVTFATATNVGGGRTNVTPSVRKGGVEGSGG